MRRSRVREMRHFLCERQQRIAFRATHPPPCMLAEEENSKGENQAETDCEGEWDDRHVAAAVLNFGF